MAKSAKVPTETTCKWCNHTFSTVRTMSNHLCVKKKRFLDQDTQGARNGLLVFNRFFQISSNNMKPKSSEEFINSKYYTDFVKFGWYLARANPIHRDLFIDYVIKSRIKITDWGTDKVYMAYLNEIVLKEPVDAALARTISVISEWVDKKGLEFNEFFTNISPNEATFLIQHGRLSPWVLYLSDTACHLLSSLNEEQYAIINPIIDPAAWKRRITTSKADVELVTEVLKAAQI